MLVTAGVQHSLGTQGHVAELAPKKSCPRGEDAGLLIA